MATELDFSERLERIESLLQSLVEQRTVKEWYSTAEVARLLGMAEFTVREWCRLGRVHRHIRGRHNQGRLLVVEGISPALESQDWAGQSRWHQTGS
jgi:hypothetical protein